MAMVIEVKWPKKEFFNTNQVAKHLGKEVNPKNKFRPPVLEIRGGNQKDIEKLEAKGFIVKMVT